MIKGITVFFLDLIVGGLASKLIDVYWGKQPEITPIIIFVVLGGVLYVFIQEERELALTWVFHRFVFLINARNQYGRMIEIKTGKNAKVFGGNSTESYLRITNGKREDDFSSLCYSRIVNTSDRQKLLIIGNPGSGKSFGLIKTAQAIAQFSIYKLGFGTPIPVLIRCDEYKGNLPDLLKSKLPSMSKGESGKVLGKGVDKLLRDGKILILFDAIDETLKDYRLALITEIENITSSPAYEDCSIIITGRRSDIDLLKFEKLGFDSFEIKDLTDSGVNRFISIYKQENQISEDIAEALKSNNLIEDNGLGRNPFWLSLMVEQNIFGADYVVILDQSIDKLMRSEFEKPKSSNRWARKLPIDTQVIETRLALSLLAFEMVRADKVVFEFEETKDIIDNFVQDRKVEGLNSYDIVGLAQDSHVLELSKASGGRQYPVRFRHPLLRDFMAACYVLNEKIIEDKFELLNQDIKRWWHVLFFSISLLMETKSPWLSFKRHKKILEILIGNESYPDVVMMIACSMTTFEKHLEEEFYEHVLIRLEQTFSSDLTDEVKKGIDNVITVAPEYVAETMNDMFKRQNASNLLSILNYMIQISIKSGHKSRLLIHLLDQHKMQDKVVLELVKFGENATGPLVEIIESEREYSIWDKIQTYDIETEKRKELRRWETKERKLAAVAALVKINPQKSVPYLKKELLDAEPQEKGSVIKLIGETRNPEFIPLLLSETKKDNSHYEHLVKADIYQAMACMGSQGLETLLSIVPKVHWVEILMSHLDDSIASYGADAVDGIRKLLKSRKDEVLLSTFWVIKKNKNPLFLPDLLTLLKGDDFFITIEVAGLLAEFGDSAIPYLIDGFSAEPPEKRMVNSFIADALAKIGKSAIPRLIEIISKPDNLIVASATEALGKIKDYRAIKPLEALLRSHKNVEVVVNAGVGLGRLKEERTKRILQRTYEDTFGDNGMWGRTVASMLGLVCWGDINMRDMVYEHIANGGLYDNAETNDQARLWLVMGLTDMKDTAVLPAMYKFKEELDKENTKESLKTSKSVSDFAKILEDILHPKKDPRMEELELARKKRDEDYEKIMEND